MFERTFVGKIGEFLKVKSDRTVKLEKFEEVIEIVVNIKTRPNTINKIMIC